MLAVAFETEIENEVIHIPKEYYGKIPYKATITIVYDDNIQNGKKELSKKRAAYERLKKYRGVIDRDMDYKQELKSALDEKYGSAN
jgi:transcription initiation factor TFIIIB Brf1 subunit/transcription initiation factor TFIIB